MLFVSLLSLACLLAHLLANRTLAGPGVAHGAIWLSVSLGYVCVYGNSNEISVATLVVLMTGIAAFSIGIYVGENEHWHPSISQNIAMGGRKGLPAMIVGVSTIGLAMMVYKAFQIAPPDLAPTWFGGNNSWFAQLRNKLNYSGGKGSFGIPGYFLNFSYAGTVYIILYSRRLHITRWLWPSVGLSLGFAFISTGRTHLVLLGCLVAGAVIPDSPRKRLIMALVLPLFGTVILVIATVLKGIASDGNMSSLFDMLVNTQIKGYVLTSVGAFNILVGAKMESTEGSMTFRTVLALFKALGMPVNVPEMMLESVTFASFPVNVYTVFSPYYRDFGVIGVAMFMAALGALHGWVFGQLKYGAPVFVASNAILFYALFMQFFQDQYFSLMSQWVQLIGWIYLFTKLLPLSVAVENDHRKRLKM